MLETVVLLLMLPIRDRDPLDVEEAVEEDVDGVVDVYNFRWLI